MRSPREGDGGVKGMRILVVVKVVTKSSAEFGWKVAESYVNSFLPYDLFEPVFRDMAVEK